jgi:hypothetical protein
MRKGDYKVGELAGDCRELRNCGSQILKVRNSAIDLVVRKIAELQRCGLKLRRPTFGNYYLQLYFAVLVPSSIGFFSQEKLLASRYSPPLRRM